MRLLFLIVCVHFRTLVCQIHLYMHIYAMAMSLYVEHHGFAHVEHRAGAFEFFVLHDIHASCCIRGGVGGNKWESYPHASAYTVDTKHELTSLASRWVSSIDGTHVTLP